MGLNLINLELMLKDFDPKMNKIDVNKQSVSQNEVIQAAKSLGLGLNVFDLQKVFEHLDQEDRGFVFVNDLMTVLKSRFSREQIEMLEGLFIGLGGKRGNRGGVDYRQIL